MTLKRYEIINKLIKKYNFKNYLEIGIFDGECINRIECENKDGVDPGYEKGLGHGVNYRTTSDEFFSKYCNKKYDIIFIDGLHHSDQVDRDLDNSLKNTVDNGIVVLHDTNPPTLEHTLIPRIQSQWNGNVYKSILKFRQSNVLHQIFTVDSDWGVTVIIKNVNTINNGQISNFLRGVDDWDFFHENRKELLNLISTNDFTNEQY